jgi:ribosomal protein S1
MLKGVKTDSGDTSMNGAFVKVQSCVGGLYHVEALYARENEPQPRAYLCERQQLIEV